MENLIIHDFIKYCINNEIDNAKEMYKVNNININDIEYDTKTSDIQGPYSLFECMCILDKIEVIKWFVEIGTEDEHYNNGFISACQYNNIEIVEYLFENKKEIKIDYNASFVVGCHLGHFKLVQWLYNIIPNEIDIHLEGESPFLYAISSNNFEVAKWLYYISIPADKLIDIHIDNNYAFISACSNGRLDICEWLYLISNHTIPKNIGLESAKVSGNQELIKWLENWI